MLYHGFFEVVQTTKGKKIGNQQLPSLRVARGRVVDYAGHQHSYRRDHQGKLAGTYRRADIGESIAGKQGPVCLIVAATKDCGGLGE